MLPPSPTTSRLSSLPSARAAPPPGDLRRTAEGIAYLVLLAGAVEAIVALVLLLLR